MMQYALFARPVVTIYDLPQTTKQSEAGLVSTIGDEGLYGQACQVRTAPGGVTAEGVPLSPEVAEVITFYGYHGFVRRDALKFVSEDALRAYLPQPLVLDADGINALAGHMDEWERRRGRVTVLTPHEGEFLRVGGDLSQGRTAAAEDFARRSGAVVVLKGPGTVVAGPDGRCRVNTTGNCGMAKGGSGDVLSGVVLALLGLGMDAFDACCCAVWLHGRAGDLAAQEKGQWGMTPTDLLERLPQALREVTE